MDCGEGRGNHKGKEIKGRKDKLASKIETVSHCYHPGNSSNGSFGSTPPSFLSPSPQVFSSTRSAGSLDRLTQGSKIPTRKRSLVQTNDKFSPRITSTPNLMDSAGSKGSAGSTGSLSQKRGSVHLTSSPQMPDLTSARPNRWSMCEIDRSLSGHLDNDFGSEDSMLCYDTGSSFDGSDGFVSEFCFVFVATVLAYSSETWLHG